MSTPALKIFQFTRNQIKSVKDIQGGWDAWNCCIPGLIDNWEKGSPLSLRN